MPIGNALERGEFVYVYDEKNVVLYTVHAGSGPGNGLKGYTQSQVNVKRGSFIYAYDERGSVMFSQSVG